MTNHTRTRTMQNTLSIELLGLLFDLAPDALMVADREGELVVLNLKAQQIFGYRFDEMRTLTIKALIPSWPEIIDDESMRLSFKYSSIVNTRAQKKSGELFEIGLTLNQVLLSNKTFTIAAIRDSSYYLERQHEMENFNNQLQYRITELENLSNSDPLTGLLNRRGLESVLKREICYSSRNETMLLAALIDLDDFKSINDNLGHATGDRVLTAVTKIFKSNLRTIDWLGRVGGDEFLVLLPCTTLFSGGSIVNRIRLALNNTPIPAMGKTVSVTASIGIVSLPVQVAGIEDVLELTKTSLKYCKSRGKNRVTVEERLPSISDNP